MLIEFKFYNYRSFKEEASLSMEALNGGNFKNSLINYKTKLLPAVAIYGKNGGGKSNIIRAFWLAVQFIKNAQRTQHEKASIPVNPFLLDDESQNKPTGFEFTYTVDNIKYIYGFSATKQKICSEYLYYAPNGQKSMVFNRDMQNFEFRSNSEKKKRKLISEAVAANQLYFAVACTMNEQTCIKAMKWFREQVFFSRDYTDIPSQLIEYSENPNMLHAISEYAKKADLGIEDMQFEIKDIEISDADKLPDNIPDDIKISLEKFLKALSDAPNISEQKLKMGEVHATSFHKGINENGKQTLYKLQLSDESDGTRKLMALAPAIEHVLECGGVLLVDELEKEMHPMLVEFIVAKFQNPFTNSKNAQIIFTTHNTELLNMQLLRIDQIYFTDKSNKTGESTLYSVNDTDVLNIRKSYLMGKYGATPNIEIEEVL